MMLWPCDNCDTMRTKAEGGNVFTVCDICWEKAHRKLDDELAEPESKTETGPVFSSGDRKLLEGRELYDLLFHRPSVRRALCNAFAEIDRLRIELARLREKHGEV